MFELSSSDLSLEDQAKELGLTMAQFYDYRKKARTYGFEVPCLLRGGKVENFEKLRALDKSMRGNHCPKCGLRGEHECVTVENTNLQGPGRIFPVPPDTSISVRNDNDNGERVESIYYSAERTGVDRGQLIKLLMEAGERPPLRLSQWKVRKDVVDRVVAQIGVNPTNMPYSDTAGSVTAQLYEYDGLLPAQISSITGESVSTINSRLTRLGVRRYRKPYERTKEIIDKMLATKKARKDMADQAVSESTEVTA